MLSGASSSGPALRRSKSLPRLPSHRFKPEEVKTVRKPITRPSPDTQPPVDFRMDGGKPVGALAKRIFLEERLQRYPLGPWLQTAIEGNPEHMQFLESTHPSFHHYNPGQKWKAFDALAISHPKLLAGQVMRRNALFGIPNSPTASRSMRPFEQRFLTRAMQAIKEDVESKPFHMYGETGVIGNPHGDLTWAAHSAAGAVVIPNRPGDKYVLHNHPPGEEPYTSSASEQDHIMATLSYALYDNRINEYITNGKDVMYLQPDNLELVKLVPDARVENVIGQFPEAFRLPDPEKPPRPFANHEAPAAFRDGWQPPAGWNPPQDYPRSGPVA
jgi:hypothetical protein